jgi:hypothetical protein
MTSVPRRAGSVIAGLLLGVVVVASVETVSSIVYPLPPGIDPRNMDALRAYMPTVPAGALYIVLSGWALGTFIGSWLATRLGAERHLADGLIVGAILLAGSVANMMTLPHPTWFWIAALIVVPIAAYAGAKIGTMAPPAAPARYSAV